MKQRRQRAEPRPRTSKFDDTSNETWVGVDGEGLDIKGEHEYTYLCAANAAGGVVGDIRDWKVGLRTEQILDFLCSLPQDNRYWTYSFGYDLAMILYDLPAKTLYELARPDTRRDPKGVIPTPYPRKWRGFKIQWNLAYFSVVDEAPWARNPEVLRTFEEKLTPAVARRQAELLKPYQGQVRRKFECWDIWKFYGFAFVKALKQWGVAPGVVSQIEAMKARRDTFQRSDRLEIERYCQSECVALGELARKLIAAHRDAGIELKVFFGAGSTGGAMLKQWGTAKFRGVQPQFMQRAIACAFVGGRFENAQVGIVEGPIYGEDIASAYPYQCTRLPCLLHGRWVRVRDRKGLDEFKTALVRYRLYPGTFKGRPLKAWGPLPFRTKEGSIVYPASSGGGWVWKEEFCAAEQHFSGVHFMGAYAWEQKCNCKPFSGITYAYRQRVLLGKEGAGLVFKNGPNSVYGKVAQSKGAKPPFQCWAWAGLITSNTRGKIISDVMNQLDDLSELLMIATDGVQVKRKLKLPPAEYTGTEDLSKPLGSWESKMQSKGVFYARPGVYFPLRPTAAEIEEVRARGIGRLAMFERNELLVQAWKRGETKVEFPPTRRFRGAVTATALVGDTYVKRDDYGNWVSHPVTLDLTGLPKRENLANLDNSLALRSFPLSMQSQPYKRAESLEDLPLEQLELEIQRLIDYEQPDGEGH